MPENSPPVWDQQLQDLLRRCSPKTVEAARDFRATGDPGCVSVVVLGVFERFLEPELRPRLRDGNDALNLYSDLQFDSLTLIEVVMILEEVFEVKIDTAELRDLRTLGDVRSFLDRRVKDRKLTGRK